MVGNHFDAEDIVQETVVKAFIHFADFRAESKFKTWLMSIAVNEVRTRRRRGISFAHFVFRFRSTGAVARRHLERFAVPPVSGERDHPAVQNAMVSLHPSYKEMIRLRAIDGLNIADTARRLSISVPAAKARYYRAVHRLSHTLARQTGRPPRGPSAAASDRSTSAIVWNARTRFITRSSRLRGGSENGQRARRMPAPGDDPALEDGDYDMHSGMGPMCTMACKKHRCECADGPKCDFGMSKEESAQADKEERQGR